MSKLTCVVAGPISTFSGYGTMSRAFVKALIKARGHEWDIKLISLRWGNTPFGALNSSDPEDMDLITRIIENNNQQPDIWIQISVSNEFQPVGKVNIGYSCLVETTILPGEMLEGMNKMTFNLVSSEHAKTIALSSQWDKFDQNKNRVGQVSLQKPVETLFLGLDTKKYKKPEKVELDLSFVEESFCFLAVGHLLPGTEDLEDRKMLGRTIKAFLEAFKDKKNKPALILKCSTGGYSYIDEERTLKVIRSIMARVASKDLPSIYLIHGELTEQEMCELYSHDKVKAFVLPGNEGFGLPYIEFSAVSSKPIICSPWSGHIDFLEKEYNVFVGGNIEQLHPSATNNFLIKESSWFKPDERELISKFDAVHRNYSKFVDGGKRQGYKSRTEFTLDKMAEKLDAILKKHMPVISKPVPLSLPKLADIKKPQVDFLEEIKQ